MVSDKTTVGFLTSSSLALIVYALFTLRYMLVNLYTESIFWLVMLTLSVMMLGTMGASFMYKAYIMERAT